MNYHSEEYEDRENKILEESEDSRQKHKEIEERYRNLVEKKVGGFSIEESLAILQKEYGIEFNRDVQFPKKSPVRISLDEDEESETDEAVQESDMDSEKTADDEDAEISEEKDEETEDSESVKEEPTGSEEKTPEEEKLSEQDKETLKENESKFREAFPEDGRFKAFYEENIEPLLNDPEFSEIRDFIYEEEDFSNEKYNLVIKAFEEKTGIKYGPVELEDAEQKAEEEPTSVQNVDVEVIQKEDITFEDLKDGVKRVHAVPIENENAGSEIKARKAGSFYMGASLTGVVLLIGALIIYSIW